MENVQDKISKELEKFVVEKHDKNFSSAARALDLKNSVTLTHWVKKTRAPGVDALQPVFDALGWQLVFPHESIRDFSRLLMIPHEAAEEHARALKQGEKVPEKLLSYILQESRLFAPLCLHPSMLEQLGVAAENALVFAMPDNSMHPTINKDDLLLIDTVDTAIQDRSLYLVCDCGRFKVRRLSVERGAIISESESSNVPVQMPSSSPDFVILGRVVWQAREMV